MTDWFNTFYNPNSIMFIGNDEFNKLTNILKFQNEQSLVQIKITQKENEYVEKLKEIELLCNDSEEINKFNNLNSLKILQKELEVIKLLTKYSLENNQLNYEFFTNSLNEFIAIFPRN